MTDHACGMGQPCHGVAASGGIALRDIGPVDVLSEPNKYTGGSLVGALGQHDLVAFAEYSCSKFITHLFRTSFVPARTPYPSRVRLWSKIRLVHKPRLFELGFCRFALLR